MLEEWKNIPKYPRYQASSEGKIRKINEDGSYFYPSLWVNPRGYVRVNVVSSKNKNYW